jgi:hypothetical protein
MAPVIRPCRPEDRAACALIYYRAIMEGSAGVLGAAEGMEEFDGYLYRLARMSLALVPGQP